MEDNNQLIVDAMWEDLHKKGYFQKDKDTFDKFFFAPGEEGYNNRYKLWKDLHSKGYLESPTYEDFAARIGLQPVQKKTTAPNGENGGMNLNDVQGTVMGGVAGGVEPGSYAQNLAYGLQEGADKNINLEGLRSDLETRRQKKAAEVQEQQDAAVGDDKQNDPEKSTIFGGGSSGGGGANTSSSRKSNIGYNKYTGILKTDPTTGEKYYTYPGYSQAQDTTNISELQGNNMVDEEGRVIGASGGTWRPKYIDDRNRLFLPGSSIWLDGTLKYRTPLDNHIAQAIDLGMKASDHSNMSVDQLKAKRNEILRKYSNGFTSSPESLQDAIDLNDIDYELTARSLNYNSKKEMLANRGHADFELNKARVNQDDLRFYERQGTNLDQNPLYVFGWQKLVDKIQNDQKMGMNANMTADGYIDYLMQDPNIESKFYAYTLYRASKTNRSWKENIDEVLDDFRQSLEKGENKHALAPDEREIANQYAQEEISRMEKEIVAGREDALNRINAWGGKYQQGVEQAFGGVAGYEHYTNDRDYSYYGTAQNLLDETKRVVSEGMHDSGWSLSSFTGASVRGMRDALTDKSTLTFGLTDAKDAKNIYEIAQKYNSDQPLTKGEQAVLDTMALNAAMNSFYKDYLSSGYKAGMTTGEALSFILQMATGVGNKAVGAVGATARSISKGGIKYLEKIGVKRFIANVLKRLEKTYAGKIFNVVKNVGKAAIEKGAENLPRAAKVIEKAGEYGAAAGRTLAKGAKGVVKSGVAGVSQAMITDAPRIAEGAYRDMTGTPDVNMNEKTGHMEITGFSNVKPAEMAVFDSIIRQSLEHGTEFAGSYVLEDALKYIKGVIGKGFSSIGKGVGKVGGKLVKRSGRLGRSLNSMVETWQKLGGGEVYKYIQDFSKEVHYDGFIGETLEELANSFGNALTVKDQNFNYRDKDGNISFHEENSVYNVDDIKDIVISCAYMSGIFGMANVASYRTPKYRANENVNRAFKIGQAAFTMRQDWGSIAAVIKNGTPDQIGQMVHDVVVSKKYNETQRKAVINYANKVMIQRGVNDGELKFPEETEETKALREAYGAGYGITEAEQLNAARNAFEQSQRTVNGWMSPALKAQIDEDPSRALTMIYNNPNVSEDEAQQVVEYLNAKATWEGAQDRKADDEEAAKAAAEAHIDERVHQENVGGDGQIHPVTLKGREGEFFVVSGDVVTGNDGAVDVNASSDAIVVVDNQGKRQMTTAKDIDQVGDVIDVESAKADAVAEIETAAQETTDATATDDAVVDEDVEQGGEGADGAGAVGNYDGVLDAMGIEDAEARQALNETWGQTQPADAMDVLNDLMGENNPEQRESNKEYWAQQPEVFNSQWRYMMGDVTPDQVNAALTAQNEAAAAAATAQSQTQAAAQGQPQVAPQAQAAAAQSQPQASTPTPQAATTPGHYEQDDDVVLNVGGQQITGFISNVTPDGKLRLQLDAPIDGNMVIDVTPEELDKMVAQPQSSEENGALAPQNETTANAPATPTAPAAQTPQSAAPETPQQESAQPSLPVGEDGNADFSNATPQEAHDYIYNDPELDEEEANQVVQNYADSAAEELAKAQAVLDELKSMPAPQMKDYGRDMAGYKRDKKERNDSIAQAQAAVDAAQREVDLWNDVQTQHMMASAPDVTNQGAPASEEGNVESGEVAAPAAPQETVGETQAPAPQEESSMLSANESGEPSNTQTNEGESGEETAPAAESEETPDERIERARMEALENRAEELAESCGLPVQVARSLDDLSDSHRRQVEKQHAEGKYVNGFYDPKTKQIVLFMPDIAANGGMRRLERTFLHEGVAHGGLRALFENAQNGIQTFDELCDQVWEMMPVAAQDSMMQYIGVKKPEDMTQEKKRIAADEYMAHLAEWGVEQSVKTRIINAIKNALRKIGIKMRLNNNDIVSLLAASRRNLTEMDKARDSLEDHGIATSDSGDALMFAVSDILEGDERKKAIKELMDVTGRSEATVKKWLKAEESLAKVILDNDNVELLDLQVDESVPSIWNNTDYPQGTVEFSNICRKRLPFTVIYQRLQEEFPNTVFDASTLEDIRNTMKENGVDVACGLCFVEDRRQLLGEIGEGFIKMVEGEETDLNENQQKALDKLRESGDNYVPNLYELLTLDGMKKLRKEHPAVAKAFVEFNNARGMQAGRLFQAYSAYHREILKWNKAKVKKVNDAGGLRIFSFSDFEAHHLIDLVQVLTDCAAKGVKVQGYTKVPEFAKAVKETKMKLNRSLIAKGKGYVDADYVPKEGEAVSPNVIDGKRLLLDTVEGINVNHPDFFDSTDNNNVGNILVGINDEQIRLAMADSFVDYIIPFHSGLSEAIRAKKGIGDWVNYKLSQLEKKRNDKGKLVNADKHGVNIYTDVLPRGEELIGKPIRNARDFQNAFFKACEEKGWVPRFSKFINKDKKGQYVYTPGYEKLLLDFKLFDKNGKLLPQEAVVPLFDNEFNKKILDDYVKGEKAKTPYDDLYEKIKERLGLPNGTVIKSQENGDSGVMFSTSPTFYSNAERAVENIKQNKATAEQWKAMLTKVGGIKSGEDKWMGLSQWLEDNKGKSLTKDEVLQFVRDNGIQMEEVEYSGIEKSPRFQELNKEYLDILNNLDDIYKEAAKRFADYVDEMEEKYGEDWYGKMSPRESHIYNRMYRAQEQGDPAINDPVDIAEREMAIRYGDDFTLAFECSEDGIHVSYQEYAAEIIGIQGETINDTRLEYTTEGLDNKREIAFVVPNVESYQENDEVHFGPENQGKAVMWVRFGETTDADGKRVLVIDEIQSNRHQDAREKGYRKSIEDYKNSGYRVERNSSNNGNLIYDKDGNFIELVYDNERPQGVPAAPFEKNWHEVAMKRMLRLAAEEGFDKVAWTTGEQQAKRYSLGRMYDSIEREDNPSIDGKRFVLSGRNMDTFLVNKEGNIEDSSFSEFNGKPLSDVVGKDLAERMMNLEDGDIIEGEQLNIGGEGMKGFYDNILPRFMDKYGKRWGVKTGTVELPNVEEAGRTMHSVDVTPEMKESVMQGQPLFSTSAAEVSEQEREVDGVPAYEANNLRFSVLDPGRDADLIAELDGQEYVTVYRTMAKVNGEYYPPMDSRDHDNPERLRSPEKLGQYTQSEELPDLAYPEEYIDKKTGEKKTRWKFNLRKSNGKSVDGVAYNPYMHTSDSALNDQFSEAQDRDDLVVVECRVPVSELDSNSYHAEKALDPVGWKPWKAGPIVSKMTGKRNLLLSRWVKPVKELSWSEVADMVSKQLGDQFDVLPSNTFSKGLRAELEKRGYQFIETDNKGIIKEGLYKGVTWSDRYYDIHPEKDNRSNKKQKRAKVAEAKARNAEAVRFSVSEAVGALRDDERVYNDLLGKVFSGVSNETRRGIVGDAMENRGYDFGAATEAWLMGLADDEAFAQVPQEDWRAVKNALGNALRENGVEGSMTDNEARYVLWKAGQIEDGVFSMAEDIVKRGELLNGAFAPQYTDSADVRFSTSPAEQIYSDNFKNWFGDWENDPENASKVVDENGRPKVVYHQTNRKQYINKKTGQNWDDLDWRERDEWDNRSEEEWEDTWEEQDFYTFDNRHGRQSIEYPAFFFAPEEDPYHEYGERTIAVYLDIKNPAIDPVIPDAGVSNTAGRDAMQALIDQGYDGVIRTEDGVPYEYIAFYPEQIKSATENNGDFSRENPDIRFSVTPRDRAIARDQYDRMMRSGRYQFVEAVQDSMLGLKKLMQSIYGKKYKYIEDVPDYENPYLNETLMSSETSAQQNLYITLFMNPLLKEIAKLTNGKGKARDELVDYMMAKHGLERNQVLADRDAKETAEAGGDYQEAYAENRERDYAGLTALTGEDDVHAAEAKAQQMVAAYEQQHDTTELWGKVNAATEATLAKLYQSGVMGKETYQKTRDMFEYYIPLRGYDEKTSDKVYGYLTSKDGPLTGGSIMKRAGGRTSKADDPFSNIAMMADNAIREGNRNLMKQTFLNFVRNHPSDAVSVSELWLQYDATKDEWVPVFPDIPADATPAEVEHITEQFEADMQQLAQQEPDKYKHGRETANIPYKVIPGNEREHQVLVKMRGQTYVLTINGNPRAAQALNGLTNPDVEATKVLGKILDAAQGINRWMSSVYTTKNPDFVVSNFVRDMYYSNTMVYVKESPNYAVKFNLNVVKYNPTTMVFLLEKWENGTLNENRRIEKLFKEFMLNGGETGYSTVMDVEKYKKSIEKRLKRETNIGRKALSELGAQLEILNRSVENAARFAAFVTSIEMGRSVRRAAYDAKEISVNFNKKGSGGTMYGATGQTLLGNVGAVVSSVGRQFHVFWNAGVQGMTNFGRNFKRHPIKASLGAGSLFAMGVFAPVLAKMMVAAIGGGAGDDDDKNAYYNLPEHVRRSNICIYAKGKWVTIPLPVEYRAIYGLGELASSVLSGNERYSDEELAMQIAGQFSQLMPLDMLEGGGGFRPLIPSAFQAPYDLWVNKSWSGLPIYMQDKYEGDEYLPEYTRVYKSADKNLVALSEWLNRITGGNGRKKGKVDINPAGLEYVLNSYLGGYFTFPIKVKKSAETAFGDREFEWKNIPFANRVIKEGDERTEAKKLKNEFFKYKEEYEETKWRLQGYGKDTDQGVFNYAKELAEMNYSKEYGRYVIFDKYAKDFEDLEKIKKRIADGTLPAEMKQEYDAEDLRLKRQLVQEMHAYEDGKYTPDKPKAEDQYKPKKEETNVTIQRHASSFDEVRMVDEFSNIGNQYKPANNNVMAEAQKVGMKMRFYKEKDKVKHELGLSGSTWNLNGDKSAEKKRFYNSHKALLDRVGRYRWRDREIGRLMDEAKEKKSKEASNYKRIYQIIQDDIKDEEQFQRSQNK